MEVCVNCMEGVKIICNSMTTVWKCLEVVGKCVKIV